MFNFKNAFIAIAIAIVIAITVASQGNVPNQTHFGGDCEARGEIMVCTQATELYVGPAR